MDSEESSILSEPSRSSPSPPSPPSPASSDLSSIASRSPSPGCCLTPDSTQEDDSIAMLSGEDSNKKRKQKGDVLSTTKRRKQPQPKPRKTQKLDLTADLETLGTEQKDQLDLLLKVLRKRRKIVVIAGAGISVSAGIPDFRSSTGLFKSLKSDHKLKASGKQLFDASVYQTDSSTSSFHDMVRNLSGLVSNAKPTAFHQMLSALGTEGRLMRLYTQNVDGIDSSLPALETIVPLSQKGPWPRTIQLHGGLKKMVCSKCRALSDFEPSLFNGPEPPPCGSCVEADRVRTDHAGKRSHGIGRLRPRIVLYNEHNPDEEAIGGVVSADLRSRPDAVIVVGTSMKIPGVRRIVREMCGVVRNRRDGVSIWLNRDGPPPGKDFEDCWDLIVKGPCDEVARQWDLSLHPHEQCTRSEIERARNAKRVEVLMDNTMLKGIMTPAASPKPKLNHKPRINLHVRPKMGKKQLKKPEGYICQKKGKPKHKVKPSQTLQGQQRTKINHSFKTTKFGSQKPEADNKTRSSEHKIKPPFLSPMLLSATLATSNDVQPPEKLVGLMNPNSAKHLEIAPGPSLDPLINRDGSTPSSELLELVRSKKHRPETMEIDVTRNPRMSNVPLRNCPGGTISPTTKPRGMENFID